MVVGPFQLGTTQSSSLDGSENADFRLVGSICIHAEVETYTEENQESSPGDQAD